ncbi:MAG: HEAT repeat domain-containing protein [Gammaproteobacteria bacterium]|nr:HEAT repeat domain-containing protein [Gammaproteobacteria bacterium]
MTEAKLLIAPGCQYCSTMMNLLGDLLKEGKIARLLMINIAEQPDEAAKHNVRSVPWLKLGEMEFIGAQSRAELEKAVEMSVSDNGQGQFLYEQLKNGRLGAVMASVERDKSQLSDLVALLKGKEVPMAVRVGVSAVLEGLRENPSALDSILSELLELSAFPDETIRADACHFLSLAGGDKAVKRLQECTKDESSMVREVATESLEDISGD